LFERPKVAEAGSGLRSLGMRYASIKLGVRTVRVINLTERDRKALRAGAVIIVTAILCLRLVPLGTRQLEKQLTDLRARATLLAHARTETDAAAELRDSASVLSQGLVQLGPALLSGNSAAEAVSDLSGRLNLAAVRSPAKVERVDPVSDTMTAGRLHRVSIHAALETDVRGLSAFLSAIDAGDPVVTIESVQIVAPAPTSGDRVAEVLKTEVTVSGWYLEQRPSSQQSPSVAGTSR